MKSPNLADPCHSTCVISPLLTSVQVMSSVRAAHWTGCALVQEIRSPAQKDMETHLQPLHCVLGLVVFQWDSPF